MTPRKPDYDPRPFKVPGGLQHLPNPADLAPEERERYLRMVAEANAGMAADREKRAKAKALAAERAEAIKSGRYATLAPGQDVRAFVDAALDGAKTTPRPTGLVIDSPYRELIDAPPTRKEIERARAHWEAFDLPEEDAGPPENQGLDADLEAAAERAERNE